MAVLGNFDVVPQYNVFKQKYSSEEKLLLSELRENFDLAISSDESLQVNEDKLLNDIKNFFLQSWQTTLKIMTFQMNI